MKKAPAAGSCDHAAQVASRALLEHGCTRLECLIGEITASYGGCCWLTDAELRAHEKLRRPDGKPYHRESIGRSRRWLARMELIESRRVFPGQRPHPKAKRVSGHGTTAKSINWRALGEKRNPMGRGERRRARRRQEQPRPLAAVLGVAQPQVAVPERSTPPRYTTMPPREAFHDLRSLEPGAPALADDDPLAIEMRRTELALSRRWASSSAPTDGSSPTGGASAGAELDAQATGPPEE